jgi:hypothetical protein
MKEYQNRFYIVNHKDVEIEEHLGKYGTSGCLHHDAKKKMKTLQCPFWYQTAISSKFYSMQNT